MNIAQVTYTDALSGPGIAASRLMSGLKSAGAESQMLVARAIQPAAAVTQLGGKTGFAMTAARQFAAKTWLRACGAWTGETLSGNFFPSGLPYRLNRSDFDVVNLHWICGEMIGIEELSRIRRPLVWTFHDEWPLLGLDHYERPNDSIRDRSSRPTPHFVDRWVRTRKDRYWRSARPTIICPSRWLADRARARLGPAASVRTIPNAVPLEIYTPRDRAEAKRSLGLPPDRAVIGFGAVNALADPRKGGKYLQASLDILKQQGYADRISLLVFGSRAHGEPMPLPAHYCGIVREDHRLSQLYSAMDAFVCPSTQDNLPNTVAEALACGIPCVAFAVGGLPDLVHNGRTGFLAAPFDAGELAAGIIRCLEPDRAGELRVGARRFAEQTVAPARVARQYLDAYRDSIHQQDANK